MKNRKTAMQELFDNLEAIDIKVPIGVKQIFLEKEKEQMKINREELYKLYMEWVEQVTEECDWKTSFGPEEIVGAIATILENNPHLYEQHR
jgi:hypothetical protein